MKKLLEKFTSLEKGQKIKFILMIVLVLALLYMLSKFFGGSTVNYPAASDSQTTVQPKIQLNAPVVERQAISKPAVMLSDLSDKQKAYLKAVNDLQMLQLQQQIAQTKQQIAQAELQAAQSNKTLQSLMQPVTSNALNNTIAEQQTPVAVASAAIPMDYQLQYIANEGGKWQVIISQNGKLINGTLGTVLPDGSQITAISGTSVTLSLNGDLTVLNIASSY